MDLEFDYSVYIWYMQFYFSIYGEKMGLWQMKGQNGRYIRIIAVDAQSTVSCPCLAASDSGVDQRHAVDAQQI